MSTGGPGYGEKPPDLCRPSVSAGNGPRDEKAPRFYGHRELYEEQENERRPQRQAEEAHAEYIFIGSEGEDRQEARADDGGFEEQEREQVEERAGNPWPR